MNAVWARFRGDVRRRWRAWLGVVASPDGRAYGTGLNRLKVLRGRLPRSRPDRR